MVNFRHSVSTLLLVVAFLVLAVIATVEYSGNAEKSAAVREGGLYRAGISLLQMAEKIFMSSTIINSEEAVSSLVVGAEGNDPFSKIKEYIKIERTNVGWELTLQNTRGIIFQKTLFLRESN